MNQEQWLVEYCDGHDWNGDVGLESFNTLEEALEYITHRIQEFNDQLGKPRNLTDYKLYRATRVELVAEKFITKIRVAD